MNTDKEPYTELYIQYAVLPAKYLDELHHNVFRLLCSSLTPIYVNYIPVKSAILDALKNYEHRL
jgi:hypothetical protein